MTAQPLVRFMAFDSPLCTARKLCALERVAVMADYDSTAQRYVDRMLGKTDKPFLKGNSDSEYPRGRMFAEQRTLFSYGNHFPLAIFLPATKTTEATFVLNGDRWGPTTGKQQQSTRGAVQRSGARSVIIPFSALDSAGIIQDTIQVIDVTADRNERITVVKHEFPDGAVWHDDEVIDEYGEYMALDANGEPWVDRFPKHQFPFSIAWPGGAMHRGMQITLEEKLHSADRKRRGYHNGYYGRTSHTEPVLYTSKRAVQHGWPREDMRWSVNIADDGAATYTRQYDRHWLGESLISAEVAYMRTRRCPDCKGSGLAPEPWQDRWAVARYERDKQNWDEFHVEREAGRLARLAEYEAAGITPSHWLLEPEAEPVAPEPRTECRRCAGRTRITERARRRATFLSGFDMNETRPSWFLCELPPKAKVSTVAEAYEALKPEAVRLAEQVGREVLRQGDIFLVPTSYTLRDLRKLGAQVSRGSFVHRTNHKATEVAVLQDGTTLVRGSLTHAPQGRRPDHKRVTIGTSWAVAVKNEVPVTK